MSKLSSPKVQASIQLYIYLAIYLKRWLLNSLPEMQELFNPVINCILTWDALGYENPSGRREGPYRSMHMGSKQKPIAESYQKPSKGSTQTRLPGCVKVKSNTRELATLRIFGSCSRTYCLLNAVFKVSKNECNVSCKGKGFETNILSSEIARAKTSFNYKSTKLE